MGVVKSALKINPAVFLDILDAGYETERERGRVKDGSKIFGLSSWKDRISSQLC